MTKKHFIALAGLHGCMPQCCHAHTDYDSAVEDLALIHDLGRDPRRELKRTGSLELNIRRYGNEYCEIVECACATPEVHNEC